METATKAKHTPTLVEIIADGIDASGDGRGFGVEHLKAVNLANAAPDLLAAAEALIEALNFAGNMKSPWHKQRVALRAAIDKARQGGE